MLLSVLAFLGGILTIASPCVLPFLSFVFARADIVYRFHARDLHVVLGPGTGGNAIRFQVFLDGRIPGADYGIDTEAPAAARRSAFMSLECRDPH